MFQPIATTDPNIDDYWKARILYVKVSGQMVARMDTCPRTNYMFKEITDLQEADALWDLGLIYYVYDSSEEHEPVPDGDWTLDDSAMRKKGAFRAAYKPSRWYPEKHRYAIRLEV